MFLTKVLLWFIKKKREIFSLTTSWRWYMASCAHFVVSNLCFSQPSLFAWSTNLLFCFFSHILHLLNLHTSNVLSKVPRTMKMFSKAFLLLISHSMPNLDKRSYLSLFPWQRCKCSGLENAENDIKGHKNITFCSRIPLPLQDFEYNEKWQIICVEVQAKLAAPLSRNLQ